MSAAPTFAFGQNWSRFLRCMTDQRLQIAAQSLCEFLGVRDLQDQSFLDIGCGSGLFSAAAWRLGARPLVSFDVDRFSVQCCRHFHQQAGSPAEWQVREGSILDEGFVRGLGTFDVVYAWGVLHHTGNMWDAIARAAGLVGSGGRFYLAIYNKQGGARGSRMWLKIKRRYNRAGPVGKWFMERLYLGYFYQSKLLRFRNPWKSIRQYQSKRGMDWRTDMIDWLGGYPYEYATVEEIFKFVRGRFPDFQLANLRTTDGLGTNSFLFERRATSDR